MSARPDTWMPMYWGDYARDTGNLNATGHGAYLMLIKHYWCTGSPLPNDDDELWRIACCDSKKEWLTLRPRIARLFILDGQFLRHKRIEKEIAAAKASLTAKAEAGRKGAERRWQNNGAPIADPSISQGQTDTPSPSPSPSEKKKEGDLRSPVRRAAEEDAEFDRFWAIYPRKDGKIGARKAWKTARKTASADAIIDGLRRYPFASETRLQKMPEGWLNDGRWEIEAGTLPLTIAHDRQKPASDSRLRASEQILGRPLPGRSSEPAGDWTTTIDGDPPYAP